MRLWFVGVALIGMLGTTMAVSRPNDGNELLEQCKELVVNKASFNTGYCLGVMQTTGDLVAAINLAVDADFRICVPSSATIGQLARVTVKFLEDSPEKLHLNASNLTVMAFQRAFPCD